jgi:hypothetical protein
MGRIPKDPHGDERENDFRASIDQVDRLMARLRRATAQVAVDPSIQAAQATLAKRYAGFAPTRGDAADEATLAEFEQQATSLLRKALKQQRDGVARGVVGAVSASVGSR